jgi:hypothetical protein
MMSYLLLCILLGPNYEVIISHQKDNCKRKNAKNHIFYIKDWQSQARKLALQHFFIKSYLLFFLFKDIKVPIASMVIVAGSGTGL